MTEVIITGASGGIGYETARLFAAEHETHVIAVSRNAGRLKKLQEVCTSEFPGCNIDILPSDITDPGLHKKITGLCSHTDILINNAGLLIKKPFDDFTISEEQQLFGVNFFGAAMLIRSLLPQLAKGTIRHVVNIGSMSGYQGSARFPGLTMYGAAKAAIASLSESLAAEYPQIRFNCLALGAVDTAMLQQAFPGYKAPVTTKQIAAFIHHFALHSHQVINGKTLPVNLSTP